MEKVKDGKGRLFLVNRGSSTFFVSLKERLEVRGQKSEARDQDVRDQKSADSNIANVMKS